MPFEGDLPVSVRTDKERLADYVLARSLEREEPGHPALRQGQIVIDLGRLRALCLRPTAWSISMVLHLALLLAIGKWCGVIRFPEEPTAYLLGFERESGTGGDGEEAGGSGSAPQVVSEAAEEPAPAPVALATSVPAPASAAATVVAEAAGGTGTGSGPALGATPGPGQGGSGGGLFGARGGRGTGLGLGRGTAQSEAAVERGLRWLAAHQDPAGAWRMEDFHQRKRLEPFDTGASALCLLAFLGAGHTDREGDFRGPVSSALRFLKSSQGRDGAFGPAFEGMMYNQALATLALAEWATMTGDEGALDAVQKGVDFLCRAQQSGGGWDYGPATTSGRSDSSVTGWQVMALKSALGAGARVPPETLLRTMGHFVRQARPQGDLNYASAAPFSGRLGCGMAAVGLASRAFLGWPAEAPVVREASENCLRNPPEWGAWGRDPAHGAYYWYYATLGLHQVGGEAWERWDAPMRELLIRSQSSTGQDAGSWDPDCMFAGIGGRLCATALNVLTLEVYYRYLPLHERRKSGEGGVESLFDRLDAPGRRSLIALASAQFDPATQKDFLKRVVSGTSPEGVRADAGARLLALGDDTAEGFLLEAAERLGEPQQLLLAQRLMSRGAPEAYACLERLLQSKNPVIRFSVVKALEAAPDRDRTLPLLARAAADLQENVRRRAEEALAALSAPTPAAEPVPVQKTWDEMRLLDVLMALEPATREEAEIRSARQAYDGLLEAARAAVAGSGSPFASVERLNRLLFSERGFSAYPMGEGTGAIYLADTLARKRSNCLGLSGLYLALAEDLGLSLQVVNAPNHCFLRLEAGGRRRNIESTAGGEDVPDAAYPKLLGQAGALRAGPRQGYLASFLASRAASRGKAGNYEGALGDLDLALHLDAASLPALSNRGNCLKALGRLGDAERDYREALRLEPEHLPSLLGLADCLSQKGLQEDAHALYVRVSASRPGSARLLALLSESFRKMGKGPEALEAAESALEADASDAASHCARGMALYRLGRMEEAERALAGAVALSPENPAIRTQLGRLYCGTRRWAEAVPHLEAALVSDRGSVEAKALLDYALEKRGQAR